MSLLLLAGIGTAWFAGHAVERFLRVIGLDRVSDRLGHDGCQGNSGRQR
jgi:hypothetical protein